MSPCGGVADAADLRTTSGDVDSPFWSWFSRFIRSVIVVHDGIILLICKEVSEMTSFEEHNYLQPEYYAVSSGMSMVCMVLAPLGIIPLGV